MVSSNGLAAELTRRHALLRQRFVDTGAEALVATREGTVADPLFAFVR